jgi:hypothetical protein
MIHIGHEHQHHHISGDQLSTNQHSHRPYDGSTMGAPIWLNQIPRCTILVLSKYQDVPVKFHIIHLGGHYLRQNKD